MEVTLLSPSCIKIKSKSAIFAVNPIGVKKQTYDAVLLFDKSIKSKELSLDGEPLIIKGPGDFEIKSVKLTGIGKSIIVAYQGKIDGIDTCITKSSFILGSKDLFDEYQIVIVEVDSELDPATFAKLNATVAILYGDKAAEGVKSLGKEPISVNKYVVTKDKLPTELQVVLLQ